MKSGKAAKGEESGSKVQRTTATWLVVAIISETPRRSLVTDVIFASQSSRKPELKKKKAAKHSR